MMTDINKNHIKYMTKTQKNRIKSSLKIRTLIFFSLMFFLLLSLSLQAADCRHFYNTGEGYQGTYSVYYHTPIQSLDNCTGQVIMNSSEYSVLKYQAQQNGYLEEVSAIAIAESFTWGFGTYISFWWLGYVIKVAKKTIKAM